MLVAVQFPSHFAVAYFREVEILQPIPRFSRCPYAMNAVGMPINLRAIVDVFIAEEIEAMLANMLGALDDEVGGIGKLTAQAGTKARHGLGAEEKLWRRVAG